MKKLLIMLLSATLIVFIMIRCGDDIEPTPIKGMQTYEDTKYKFKVNYPENWAVNKTQGRIVVTSFKEGVNRFSRYDPSGLPAAKIDVMAREFDTNITNISELADKMKVFEGKYYTGPESVMINGVEAQKYSYTFELEDGHFVGEFFVAAKDTGTATAITFEAFGGSFDMYESNFKEILNSIELAVTPEPMSIDTQFVEEESPPPSENLTTRRGDGFTIQIPENFDSQTGSMRDAIASRNFIGMRRADCNIQVDVIDASEQNKIDKIVEDNRAKFGNAAPKDTKLGGTSAKYLEWTPVSGVKQRVYFAVKGDRLYRITMNWFIGEQDDYLPIFEKSIASFKFN